MKSVTINISDERYPFFMELVRCLKFVDSIQEGNREEVSLINDLMEGFNEIELYQKGQLQLKDAQELIKEL